MTLHTTPSTTPILTVSKSAPFANWTAWEQAQLRALASCRPELHRVVEEKLSLQQAEFDLAGYKTRLISAAWLVVSGYVTPPDPWVGNPYVCADVRSSLNNPETYTVSYLEEAGFECSCSDFETNACVVAGFSVCQHILAADLVETLVQQGTNLMAEQSVPYQGSPQDRPTYRTNPNRPDTGQPYSPTDATFSGGFGQPPSQMVYHHHIPSGPRLNVKLIKNTKGYNYEVTVTNATSPYQALALIEETESQIKSTYTEEG